MRQSHQLSHYRTSPSSTKHKITEFLKGMLVDKKTKKQIDLSVQTTVIWFIEKQNHISPPIRAVTEHVRTITEAMSRTYIQRHLLIYLEEMQRGSDSAL